MFGNILKHILLNESASPENVVRAMDNHAMVIINYHSDGKDNNTGSRVIMPFAYGLTKNGDPVIRAFQPYGDTTSVAPGWKMFRLDRISYWEETKRRFHDMPDPKFGEVNLDGDEAMQTVIKNFRSTIETDATNGINVGPKTKEKVYARTGGDGTVEIGDKNIKNQKASISIDLDNNAKAGANFNAYTTDTQDIADTTGPREPDQSYQPDVNGSVENGDISQEELDQARSQVYNGNPEITDDMWDEAGQWSDYSHEYTDDEWNQAMLDQSVMNRENWQNKDLSTSKRKWERANAWQDRADNGFLGNHVDSGNRELYNMDMDDEDL